MNVIEFKKQFFCWKKNKEISGTFIVDSVDLNDFSDKYVKFEKKIWNFDRTCELNKRYLLILKCTSARGN